MQGTGACSGNAIWEGGGEGGTQRGRRRLGHDAFATKISADPPVALVLGGAAVVPIWQKGQFCVPPYQSAGASPQARQLPLASAVTGRD